MKRRTSEKEKGITLIALIVTIVVLLILAGVSIKIIVDNHGMFNKAKMATKTYKNSESNEQVGLDEAETEIDKYTTTITYTDENGKNQTLNKDTQIGTKVATTANIDGQTLDWYLFDKDEKNGKAYLISTPICWVPDTTKEVNGAWVPKLVANPDTKTGAMNQAIQRKSSATDGNYSYSYSSSSVTYKPSDNTLKYYKETNSLWSSQRKIEFEKLNENEQCACYLADADIFSGIKNQVNNAKGNLQGKIQTLVGGPSIEQWTKAYAKQKITHQITAEYGSDLPSAPGYLYKVNNEEQNSGWYTNSNVIDGDDVYGAASTNKHTDATKYPFYSWCWIASPSSRGSSCVCGVIGRGSYLDGNGSCDNGRRLLLFASVGL